MIRLKEPMSMIFYGSTGVGKTSVANIFMKSVDCDSYAFNASEYTDNSTFHKEIKSIAMSSSLYNYDSKKIIFIDEADSLNAKMQSMLTTLIEKTYDTCVFIFATNHLEKITAPIQSRLRPVNFNIFPSDRSDIMKSFTIRLKNKLNEIEYPIAITSVDLIVKNFFPDYRRIIKEIEFQREEISI